MNGNSQSLPQAAFSGFVQNPALVARQTGLLDRGMYEAASGNVGLTPDDAPAAERDAA